MSRLRQRLGLRVVVRRDRFIICLAVGGRKNATMPVLLFNFLSQCILRQGKRLFRAGELICRAQGRYKNAHDLAPSFPRRNAEPAFLFVYLHIVKTRLLQIRLQLGVLVDGHAADDLRPLLVLVRIAVAFVADE